MDFTELQTAVHDDGHEALYDVCRLNLGIERPTYTFLPLACADHLLFDGDEMIWVETQYLPEHVQLLFMLYSNAPVISAKKAYHEQLSVVEGVMFVFNLDPSFCKRILCLSTWMSP